MNKSTGMFFVASLSLILLTSTIAIPLQASAEPDTTKVPVVILFNDKVSSDKIDLIKANGGDITRKYTIINGLAANLPPQAIQALENNPSIITIDPDIEFHALELNADETIGANILWGSPTFLSGNGVKIAILDTGIDRDHQEFSPARIIECESEMGSKEPTCDDLHGHGTHVAGIAGAAGVTLAAKGVAYDVSFLIDKVLDKRGRGSLSGIIDGMDWAVANGADVISMSLGTSAYYNQGADHCDLWYPSMTTAVNNAVLDYGVSVVAAAGNSGASGVGLPACISNTIAVAAVDDFNTIAYFSSIGGSVEDHGISAPGVAIYSSLPGNNYASWSGTSMATPVVTGSIALLLQTHDLSPSEVKAALFLNTCTSSTSPDCLSIPDTSNIVYGHGLIDVLSAYNSLPYIGPIVNDPPTAIADSYNTQEDTALVVGAPGILSNDTDPEDDLLTAIKVDDVSNGALTFSADGSFTYTPNAGATNDSFTYYASDGINNSDPVTVTINVIPPNDPPTAIADSYYTQEDTLLTVPIDGVLGNDTDPTNDPLTAIKVDDVSNGALTFSADGSFTYNPDSNFNGADSFTYYASDGINNSDPVTVTINVDPVNDPPTAIADSYDVQEGTMLDVVAPGILSNDTDPEDDPLTAIKVDDVSNGALTFSADGSFTYTPNAGATNDSFTYHAFDGTNSNIVTVTINVIPDAATNIFVEDSIGYTTNGGKDGTKHLTHIIHFIDDDGISVSGAIVAITLTNLDTDSSWPGTGTTDENGFVSFTLKNAPTGCYTTTVESVDSALVWDDITPSNNHGLRTSC